MSGSVEVRERYFPIYGNRTQKKVVGERERGISVSFNINVEVSDVDSTR